MPSEPRRISRVEITAAKAADPWAEASRTSIQPRSLTTGTGCFSCRGDLGAIRDAVRWSRYLSRVEPAAAGPWCICGSDSFFLMSLHCDTLLTMAIRGREG